MAPQQIRMQNAAGVGFLAQKAAEENQLLSAQELTPVYLRLSQAERERLEREKQAWIFNHINYIPEGRILCLTVTFMMWI